MNGNSDIFICMIQPSPVSNFLPHYMLLLPQHTLERNLPPYNCFLHLRFNGLTLTAASRIVLNQLACRELRLLRRVDQPLSPLAHQKLVHLIQLCLSCNGRNTARGLRVVRALRISNMVRFNCADFVRWILSSSTPHV
jgi:hypothetical protein